MLSEDEASKPKPGDSPASEHISKSLAAPLFRGEQIKAVAPLAHSEATNSHEAALRSRTGPMEPPLDELINRFKSGQLVHFQLATFDGQSVQVSIHQALENRLGVQTLVGQLSYFPGSTVILAKVDGAIAGSIRIPSLNTVYEVRPAPRGEIIFNEVDLHALGECQMCFQVSVQNQNP